MKYQRISTQKLNKIFLCFSEDITATVAARIAGVNRNTANSYYRRIRELVFEESLKEAGREFGEFECDESYFGARRVRGKRGRGAAGKTPVFGLLKRGEKVYVKVHSSCFALLAAQARREGVRQGGRELLAGELNADNTRTYA